MAWEWAIGDAIIIAILLREWISVKRELRHDREKAEAEMRSDLTGSTPAGHAKREHELNERVSEPIE